MLHKCLSEVLGHHFLLEQVSVLFCVLCLTHWSKFCHNEFKHYDGYSHFHILQHH